ncbi:hypothetical protein Tco_0829494 [Tanacetum coccineum]
MSPQSSRLKGLLLPSRRRSHFPTICRHIYLQLMAEYGIRLTADGRRTSVAGRITTPSLAIQFPLRASRHQLGFEPGIRSGKIPHMCNGAPARSRTPDLHPHEDYNPCIHPAELDIICGCATRLICAWLLEVDGRSVTSYRMIARVPTLYSGKLVGFSNTEEPIIEIDNSGYQTDYSLLEFNPIHGEFQNLGTERNGDCSFFIAPYKESLLLLSSDSHRSFPS